MDMDKQEYLLFSSTYPETVLSHVASKLPLWLILRWGHRICHQQTLGNQTSRDMTNTSLISFNPIACHKFIQIEDSQSASSLFIFTMPSPRNWLDWVTVIFRKKGGSVLSVQGHTVPAFLQSSELPRRTRELKNVKEWMRANSVWFRREKKAPSTPGLLKETAAVAAITKIHEDPGAHHKTMRSCNRHPCCKSFCLVLSL